MAFAKVAGTVRKPDEAARAARRAAREAWPLRRFALGDEPCDDLRTGTSARERLEMVWLLTRRSWRLAARSIPDYERAAAPGRLVRGGSAE